MKKVDLIKQFNLPGYVKGKTATDAVKAIENQFKDRKDKISMDTKQELLERVKMVQEYVKEQNGLQAPQNQKLVGGPAGVDAAEKLKGGGFEGVAGIGAMADGAVSLTGRLMDKPEYDIIGGEDPMDTEIDTGGNILGGAAEGAKALAGLGPLAAGLGAVGGGIIGGIQSATGNQAQNRADQKFVSRKSNMANNQYAYGGLEKSPCGGPGQPPCPDLDKNDLVKINATPDAPLQFSNDGEGIAAMNRLFKAPPTVEAAKVNLGKYKDVNYFDFDKSDPTGTTLVKGAGQIHNDDAIKRQFNSVKGLNPGVDLKYNNAYAYGGIPNKKKGLFQPGITPIENPWDQAIAGPEPRGLYQPGFEPSNVLKNSPTHQDANKRGSQLGDFLKSEKFSDGANMIGRLAPAISDAAQLFSAKRADPTKLDRLDARYKPQYADEAAAEKRINNITGNLSESIANASSGSTGALRSNLLGAYLKKGQLVSEEANKIRAANQNENTKAQQFNLQVDTRNLHQSNQEQQINAQDEGAYNTAKSQMGSRLADSVGNLGLERTREGYAKKMGLLYDSKGNYIGRIDKATGKFISAAEENK